MEVNGVSQSEAAPYVTKSSVKFRDNFWGSEDAGMDALMSRTKSSLSVLESIDEFYAKRASIEREYASKLQELAASSADIPEVGSTLNNILSMRTETGSMAKAHEEVSQQINTELRNKIREYIDQTEQQKVVAANAIEELYQKKTALEIDLSEKKDAYEYSCNKLNSYMRQTKKMTGRELDKYNLKIRQAALAVKKMDAEYRETNELLLTVTREWIDRWTEVCDAFQHIEEYRLEFLKTNMWAYANIISTACVKDDESCEKIRLTLENTNIDEDITQMIQNEGTGTTIPPLPEFNDYFKENGLNYDIDQLISKAPSYPYSSSRPSASASLASSPTRSAFRPKTSETVSSEVVSSPPTSPLHSPVKPVSNEQVEQVTEVELSIPVPSIQEAESQKPVLTGSSMRRPSVTSPTFEVAARPLTSMDVRSSHNAETEVQAIPAATDISPEVKEDKNSENAITKDNDDIILSSQLQPTATGSRSSRLSFSRHGHGSQTSLGSIKRKSIMERMGRPTSPFMGSSFSNMGSRSTSPTKEGFASNQHATGASVQPDELEDIDPRANVVLNVGPNMLSVGEAPVESTSKEEDKDVPDPIANAMAELSSSMRRRQSTSVDDEAPVSLSKTSSSTRLNGLGYHSRNTSIASDIDGVPKKSTLGAPPAAHTSAQMQRMSNSFASQTKQVFGEQRTENSARESLRHSRSNMSRSPSPMLSRRSSTLRPSFERSASSLSVRQSDVVSPAPSTRARGQSVSGQQRPSSSMSLYGEYNKSQPQLSMQRSVSPNPLGPNRRSSSVLQSQKSTSSNTSNRNNGGYSGSRPSSEMGHRYGSMSGRSMRQVSQRSTSRARSPEPTNRNSVQSKNVDPRATFTAEGEPILGYVIALYDYQAQIPEEISFQKGDTLMVLRTQEDGWWDGEIINVPNSKRGLFPSNFVQTV
ncbi:Cell division control protein Cdc15 [Schizosaccharomyces pombe]